MSKISYINNFYLENIKMYLYQRVFFLLPNANLGLYEVFPYLTVFKT